MYFQSRLSGFDGRSLGLDDEALAQRNRTRKWLLIAVAAIAVLALGYYLFGNHGNTPAAKSGDNKQAPHVTVITAGRQPVANLVSATGTLAARREMPVGVVGEGGMVSRVWVEPGTWVAAGQVLASIERSVQSQEAGQLSANVSVAQADARLAQSELERAQSLVGRGFISKADIDRKTATRDAAAARVRVAQAQLGGNQARIGRLDIRAPEAGLVLTRSVEPGQIVSAGSGPLFRIARGGEMELRAQLSEADLAHMSVGMAAAVTPVGTTAVFNGQIWQMPQVVEASSRQGIVRIALAYNTALRPGGFASADIVSGRIDAPLLPQSAIQSDEKGNYVLIVDANNKVVRRDVKIGSVSDSGAPILAGLAGNELVILSAGAFLNPGESVIPERAKRN